MGASGSKEPSRKRAARESWYAPVSRSASAPIHYVAEADADYSASTLSMVTTKKSIRSLQSFWQAESAEFVEYQDDFTIAKAMEESSVYTSAARDDEGKPRKRAAIASAGSRYRLTLIPVAEECDDGNTDTEIKAERQLEDQKLRNSPPSRAMENQSVLEKSKSFNRVHGLDSCFTELRPLVWRKYLSEQGKQTGKNLDLSRLNSSDENGLCMHQSLSNATSSAKSSSKTPSETPFGSPRSPLTGPCSPLFDPSLLTKFEESVDALTSPQDDIIPHISNEKSLKSSPLTRYQATRLSEAVADRESPHSMHEVNVSVMAHELPYSDASVTEPCKLHKCEAKCPPNGDNKVVLYFTSLRGIRKTYDDCCVLRRILQGMGVRVDERDVWMHCQFREELTQLLGKHLQVPRLFIKGKYIGGVEESCQLHEDGLLADLVIGMQCFGYHKACDGCADMRFVPCLTCHGSCKVLNDSDQVVRCGRCNENGLVLCPLCS